MKLLVAYDISDDKRRTKVALALERLGRRVQHSVFLLNDRDPQIVADTLRPLIDPGRDNVRLHPLCAACMGKAIKLGLAREPLHPDTWRIL